MAAFNKKCSLYIIMFFGKFILTDCYFNKRDVYFQRQGLIFATRYRT